MNSQELGHNHYIKIWLIFKYILIRNHSANNSQSLFARIGFFDIIIPSQWSFQMVKKSVLGRLQKQVPKALPKALPNWASQRAKIPQKFHCLGGKWVKWGLVGWEWAKRKERPKGRSRCANCFVLQGFSRGFIMFLAYLKYLLSIPSRALPWRASSRYLWVPNEFFMS